MSALRNLMRTIYDYSIFNPLNKNTRAPNAIGISRLPRVNNEFFSTTVNTLFKAIKYFFPRFHRTPSMNELEKKQVTFLTNSSVSAARASLEECMCDNKFIDSVLAPYNTYYYHMRGLSPSDMINIESVLRKNSLIP